MKALLPLILLELSIVSFAQPNISGAWQAGTKENNMVMIVADKFYSVAVYNQKDKSYIGTYGGTFRIEKDAFISMNEFNTLNKEDIGVEVRSAFQLKGNAVKLATYDFKRLDDGKPGQLAGAWLITARVTGNGMQTMTPGVRKTMKILSGTRF